MSELKKTITSIFMVPTLNLPKDALKENGFINGYAKDIGKDIQYENAIYLLFKPIDLDKFRIFLDSEYERTKAIIDDYDYESGFVVVVYQLETKFKKDYSLIRKGKYSKTTEGYKLMFPKNIRLIKDGIKREDVSLQYRVFNRTQDLIDFWEEKLNVKFDEEQELWHEYNEENEILDITKFKEYA